ncbi:MAG: hypothetical protein QOD77_2120 [Thermoplasmata archaeon]|nr:hypothetical protein [Thermoplasmata archaeon]
MVAADVLVSDLDRTFSTEDLELDPDALKAAEHLRKRGVRCVLATGRGFRVLSAHPLLTRAFDGFVLEGGAVWGTPGDWRLTKADLGAVHAVADALEAQRIPVRRRSASCSIAIENAAALAGIPASGQCSLQRNRDRMDILPMGVDKGVGLRRLLESWGEPDARVVAVGDGENDLGLFAASTYTVAVANAVPALRAAADEVAPLPASQGFAWVVRERLTPVPASA